MNELKIAQNEEVEALIEDENSIILDVREISEYALQHVPNALLIPLGELDKRLNEVSKEKAVYVICRTGNRSEYAARFLLMNGYENVYNVLPGMIGWTGKTESQFN